MDPHLHQLLLDAGAAIRIAQGQPESSFLESMRVISDGYMGQGPVGVVPAVGEAPGVYRIHYRSPIEVEEETSNGGPFLLPPEPNCRTFLLALSDEDMYKVLDEEADAAGLAFEVARLERVLQHTQNDVDYVSKSGMMSDAARGLLWGLNLYCVRWVHEDGYNRLKVCPVGQGVNFEQEELLDIAKNDIDLDQAAMSDLLQNSVLLTLSPDVNGVLPPWASLANDIVLGRVPPAHRMTAVRVSNGEEVGVMWALTGQTGPMSEYRPTRHVTFRLNIPEMGHTGCGLALWGVHYAAVSPLHRTAGRVFITINRYFALDIFHLGAVDF